MTSFFYILSKKILMTLEAPHASMVFLRCLKQPNFDTYGRKHTEMGS